MRHWKTSLIFRLVVSFLFLTLTSVGIAAWLGYLQASNALTESFFDRLEAVAEFKIDELDRWLEEQRREVTFVAWSPELRDQIERLLTHSDQEAYFEITDYLNTLTVSKPSLQDMFILAADDGRVLVSTNPSQQNKLKLQAPYFINGQTKTFIQTIYRSPETNQPTMTISTPIIKGTQTLGVLVTHLNLNRLTTIILDSESLGDSAEAYLVTKNRQFVTPPPEIPEPTNDESLHSSGIDAALQGIDGRQAYLNYNQVPVIGVYRWLPEYEAAFIIEMAQQEADIPARDLAVSIIVVGLALTGFLAVAIFLLAQQVVGPISTVTNAARRMAAGDLEQIVPVLTEDEIGILAQAFNDMQRSLQLSHQELGRYAHTLEQRVEERTAELQQANRVLSERAIQLETSSKVGQQAAAFLNLEELLSQVVNLIQGSFGYYFVGVWLLTDKKDAVILQAGQGRTAKDIQDQDRRISIETYRSIIVKVCKTGQYYTTNDTLNDSQYMFIATLPDTRSELALPLKIGNEIIGVLDIQSDHVGSFTHDDHTIFEILAGQIAIAIRNAQLYQGEQTRREFAESLQETGRLLTSSLDLNEVPDQILKQLANVIPYERGLVLLRQDNILEAIAHQGFPDDERATSLRVSIRSRQDDVFRRMIDSHRPVLVDDVTQESGWQQVSWLPMNYSWLGVPLIAQDKVIGMISLTRPAVGAFTTDDAQLVLTFAAQAAIALENARLYNQIVSFNEQLEQRVEERTAELNRAYQILEQLDKTKSDFIKVSAHELRTPLTVVSGYAQVLNVNSAIKKDDNASVLLQGIISGVDRLYQIVNTMLDWAKIASDSLEIHREEIELATLITKICRKFAPNLTERQLSLTLTDELTNLPLIQADPDLISKLFYNLITNAIKYTPDGGSIRIDARTVTSNGQPEPDMVEVVICDSGIGIDPDYQELIFEKFFQTGKLELHSSGLTKFKGAGPGLGLAIVKGIVLGHGGQIWVESPGYDEQTCPGSKFFIRLPVSKT